MNKKYLKVISKLLSEKRVYHSKCVAESAVLLAKKFGANAKDAEIAGILHDVTKEMSIEDQFKYLRKAGIDLSHIELSEKSLYHQISGMAYCMVELDIDNPDILNAIRYHTSGRKDMSMLEKVIFVADCISEDRDFNGVEQIRLAAENSLDEAMVVALSHSIAELANEQEYIIEDTIHAYNTALRITEKKKG